MARAWGTGAWGTGVELKCQFLLKTESHFRAIASPQDISSTLPACIPALPRPQLASPPHGVALAHCAPPWQPSVFPAGTEFVLVSGHLCTSHVFAQNVSPVIVTGLVPCGSDPHLSVASSERPFLTTLPRLAP